MSKATVIFFIITFVNVMLSTIKSILTVKASKGTAALINATAYGFYAMVVKQMATVSTEIVVIATVLCNLIGVYLSMWLLDKLATDVLWKISVVAMDQETAKNVKEGLELAGLGYNEYSIMTECGKSLGIDVFSKTSAESKKVKEILQEFTEIKYHIVELNKNL